MKNKKLLSIAFYTIVIGWIPFMCLCIWGLNQEPIYRAIIALVGASLCLGGSLMILPTLNQSDLFKSIDELEEERLNYLEAVKRLNKKIREL